MSGKSQIVPWFFLPFKRNSKLRDLSKYFLLIMAIPTTFLKVGEYVADLKYPTKLFPS